FHGGLVDGFMKSAGGSAAFANARCADGALYALEPMRQQRAVDYRNHSAQVTDHRQQALLWPATMDVAVPGAHRTQPRAEIGADRIQQRLAKGQAPGRVPDKGRKNVPFPQREANRHAQGFLAAPKEDPAVDLAHAIETGKFVIQDA